MGWLLVSKAGYHLLAGSIIILYTVFSQYARHISNGYVYLLLKVLMLVLALATMLYITDGVAYTMVLAVCAFMMEYYVWCIANA